LYAIATEREFNASRLILGRSHPDVPDPSAWQWASGFQELDGQPSLIWSGSLKQSVPILTWVQHITYPEMAYDSPIHRYLLTFTYSYAVSPPAIWRNGEELIILEAPHPWGTVLVRRAPTRVRTLQRLRAGHPDQVDQPRRAESVAEVVGQLRRVSSAARLLRRLRIQLPPPTPDPGGRPLN
jgi:hypothetical protein